MRIRSIKPEFWRSGDVSRLSRELRLLFIGLWSYVDDNGVGIDDFRQIAADLFPLDDDPQEVRGFVRRGLDELSRVPVEGSNDALVVRYEVSGKRYLFITGWDHQKIDRPSTPRYPRPLTSGDADEDSLTREGSRGLDAVTGEQGNRGTGEEKTSPVPTPPVREDIEALCLRLEAKVIGNGAKAAVTGKWRAEARLLLDRDQREFGQALRLIDWATSHSFWKSNILSMPTFRKQYDKLLLQARSEQEQAKGTTAKRVEQVRSLYRPEHPELEGGAA